MLKFFLFFCSYTSLIFLISCQQENLPSPSSSPSEITETEMLSELHRHNQLLTNEISILETELAGTPRNVVVLATGSVDGLATAIAEAGPGGTVLVESGPHSESGTVLIEHQVSIIGETGAKLIFDTQPLEIQGFIQAALHFRSAPRSVIRGLSLESLNSVGGAAILIEDSDRTVVIRNVITDYQFGIMVQNSDRIYAIRNEIAASPLWQTQTIIFQSFGIVVANGSRARIYSNILSGGITGVWACDRFGYIAGNEFFGNLEGIILCKVPFEYNYLLPDGSQIAAELSCERWVVIYNDSHDNLDYGYQIIDGANKNFLVQNQSKDNLNGDYEFAGETTRFGLSNPSPTSEANIAWIANEDSFLDCGHNNFISGGVAIEHSGDNCF